jgi:hypothetical protein
MHVMRSVTILGAAPGLKEGEALGGGDPLALARKRDERNRGMFRVATGVKEVRNAGLCAFASRRS